MYSFHRVFLTVFAFLYVYESLTRLVLDGCAFSMSSRPTHHSPTPMKLVKPFESVLMLF
jgi:hypothetical protein